MAISRCEEWWIVEELIDYPNFFKIKYINVGKEKLIIFPLKLWHNIYIKFQIIKVSLSSRNTLEIVEEKVFKVWLDSSSDGLS